jgi:uncharacterized protein (DUF427 family)
MRTPGPDHPIAIAPNPKRVRVMLGGKVIADTRRALTLREASLPPVQYIPREDADLSLLNRTDHATHCPYKGDASYFTISAGDRTAENAVWSYEQPFAAMAAIAGRLAFYPERVDSIEETAGLEYSVAISGLHCRRSFRNSAAVRRRSGASCPAAGRSKACRRDWASLR